ncbi:Plasmodium exported protein, unknown function [Plasmodium relictum]|uniref:Fam-h protein n=1 Tax=Plasmodium relictum TaxID=85471 RepID=A0A1J1GKD1_PLARL|nr:Plasmodium exported protein, unknown function [Plasmodium relictum]CRG84884.1 Plasmodium exported protein, unknown function [Plasmodium relictum]
MKNDIIFYFNKCYGYNTHIDGNYITIYLPSSKMYHKKNKINTSLFFKFILFILLVIILQSSNTYIYRSAKCKHNIERTINLIYKRILSQCSDVKSKKSESKLNLLNNNELQNGMNEDLQSNLNCNNSESKIKTENPEVIIFMLKEYEKKDKNDKKNSKMVKCYDYTYIFMMIFPFLLFITLSSILNMGYSIGISESRLQTGYLSYISLLSLLSAIMLIRKKKKKYITLKYK